MVSNTNYYYQQEMMYHEQQQQQRHETMNNYYNVGHSQMPYTEEEMQMQVNTSPYYNQQGQFHHYDSMGRRYSSPQMGYYDLITGEYRYRNDNNYNQSSAASNYVGETEPPMCENTCQWCQIRLPFNCLTISLMTCLMLLIMFSCFHAVLNANPKNAQFNTSLFDDMILLMSSLTIILFLLTIIRYICIDKFHLCNFDFCQRCHLFGTIITDVFTTSGSKHNSYGLNPTSMNEQFV